MSMKRFEMVEDRHGLSPSQIRVLYVLYHTRGCLKKSEISDQIGAKRDVSVGKAIGYSDPIKRAKFRKTLDGIKAGTPLLDKGYVEEKVLDIDGAKFTGYVITQAGIEIFEKLGEVKFVPPPDAYAKIKGRE